MTLAGSAVIIYMKKMSLTGFLDPKDGAFFGALSGFMSFIGFALTFLPLATILGIFFKSSYFMGISLIVRSGVFVLLLTLIFVALLSALMNAFSGLATAYIYAQTEQRPEENVTNIEIKE
jgi:ABC-type sulfate transport system permease component